MRLPPPSWGRGGEGGAARSDAPGLHPLKRAAAIRMPVQDTKGASYWLSTSSGTVKTCPGYMRSGSRINAELALKMML